ncbi:TrmH family RNA methyltransferase [Actinomyces howellii]|uniref:rRNA (Adenosine-2'-O-)-methyltransferase n=1 Tax=Actinomyces howellii TaxID=52771 RepID=A0A448HHT7_9ACTO|nr:TrmH family RNA methyltransferase [Actinomyces howellii]VEG28822.1 rRNA (adenosine-2'-O-)-methyltransferase [Actinomyces howellii]
MAPDEIVTITQRSDPAIQRIADISKPRFKPGSVMFLEDELPVAEAIRAGVRLVEVYADASHVPEDLVRLCASYGVPFRLIASPLMASVFKSGRRPEVVAVASTPPPAHLEDIDLGSGDVVVLDGVRIVGNIGAIVRSAFALGAAGVVLCDSQLDTVMDRRLVRASRGYVFSLPVVLAEADEVLRWARGRCRLVGLAADGRTTVGQVGRLDEPLGLVFGSELRGMSPGVGAAVDLTATIPMVEGAESLNVSVAAGIALFARSRLG